jgi:hypothetical protein
MQKKEAKTAQKVATLSQILSKFTEKIINRALKVNYKSRRVYDHESM